MEAVTDGTVTGRTEVAADVPETDGTDADQNDPVTDGLADQDEMALTGM